MHTRKLTRRAASLGVALLLSSGAVFAAPPQRAVAHRAAPAPRSAPAPRAGAAPRAGGAPRMAVPRGTATRAPVGARGTANGVARYGYGGYYGGYYGGGYPYYGYPYYGYPCYGWGYPYWGGYYGWGWPYYGLSFGYYGGGYYAGGDEGGGYAPSGPAVVETDVSPGKAEVILDGSSAGNAKDYNGTWDELRVEPGRHTITFRKDGYKSLTIAFDAAPGGHYKFDQDLAKGEGEEKIDKTSGPESPQPRPQGASARGLLRIRIAPEDAVVYLDGAYLGTGFELAGMHGALSVGAGEHTVEVTRPGYKPESRKVIVDGEGQALLDVNLEHAP